MVTVTRTELHERLAEAWEALGNADSAVVHYRAVVAAWSVADALLAPRLDGARAHLSSVDRSQAESPRSSR